MVKEFLGHRNIISTMVYAKRFCRIC